MEGVLMLARSTLLIVPILIALLAIAGVSPAGDTPLAEDPGVRVALAIVEGQQDIHKPLHVIIENISGKPQEHFSEWNSWGYGNLSVKWTDAAGKMGVVKKVPGAWHRNGPATTVLQPGESLVRELSFDPKLWVGWPALTNGSKLSVKVTYRSTGEPKIDGSGAGWVGEVTSKEAWFPLLVQP
jgi:hypothetical protein